MKYIFCTFFFCISFVLTNHIVFATSPKDLPESTATQINANFMEYDAATQIVKFSGNVYVKRPDFDLTSKYLTVYLKKSTPAEAEPGTADKDSQFAGMAAGDIDRIVATKDVVITSDNKKGRCQKATYFSATDKFVMEESPVLTENENIVRGHTIVYFLKENRSVVQGATTTFFAPDKTVQPAGKP